MIASLRRRWRRNRSAWPRLRWQTSLFLTANFVLLAGILFDPPLGAMAKTLASPVQMLGRVLTDFGKSGWIICISAFLFFEGWAISRRARSIKDRGRALQISAMGFYLLASVSLSGLLANLLKRAIGRARPVHFEEWGVFTFRPFAGEASFESFPSGHATTIGALFAALALLFPRHTTLMIVLGVWFGMTRIMVGAHYPSDVIAGLALGAWFSFIMAIIFSRYGLIFQIGQDGWPAPRRFYSAR